MLCFIRSLAEGNNGEVFLLRRFAPKQLGPSVYRFLATLPEPLQVSPVLTSSHTGGPPDRAGTFVRIAVFVGMISQQLFSDEHWWK